MVSTNKQNNLGRVRVTMLRPFPIYAS